MSSGISPEKIRILFVDDDDDFRNILTFSFQRKGYQVFSASGGREAMEIIRRQPVDVVISDIRMPEGDGIELLDQIKNHSLKTPIVLLVTGYADIATEDAHDMGAEALLAKPFDRKVLEETIHRLLTPPGERWANEQPDLKHELKVKLQFPSLLSAIEAKVVNVGRGGMYFRLEDRFPNVNDEVSFSLELDLHQIRGTGIVRWVRCKSPEDSSPGCGIEFSYIAENDRVQILELLEKNQMRAYIPKR